MELKQITKSEFDFYYNLLEQDFIFEERRSKEKELESLDNKNFRAFFIYSKSLNKNVGYFTYWQFDTFIFGEHFAIFKEFRNQGLGTEFVTQLVSNNKPFIFEIERPITPTNKRRLKLYERIGFKILDKNYFQPSYHNSTDKTPMYIIGYNAKKLNLKDAMKTVYKNVYELNV